MITPQQLEQFGLNSKESRVYLASLELGMDSVQNIAKTANIHRVSTYDILEALQNKGLVNQIQKGKKRYFTAVDPEQVLAGLKEKQETFNDLVPQLKAMQQKGKAKPKVMYYEGKKAVWDIYFDRIRHENPDKMNLVFGGSEPLLKDFPTEYKRFTKDRLEKGIKAKIIVEESQWSKQEMKMSEKELREVKLLPQGKKFKANTIIYGNRVMIVSWQSMLAVIIEDQNYADNQRILFDLLWQYLP